MVAKKYCLLRVFLTSLVFCNSCKYFPETIRIDVPKNYEGWCFIIPTSETAKISVLKNSKYRLNEYGIVYVPASKVDNSEVIIKVYDSDIDISNSMRYGGTINRVKTKEGVKTRYKFIRFLLPTNDKRTIPVGNIYWHDQGYEYREHAGKVFDSLVTYGKLVFN